MSTGQSGGNTAKAPTTRWAVRRSVGRPAKPHQEVSVVYPADLRFSKDHEWARVTDAAGKSRALIGISQYAADQLGDVVWLEVTSKLGATIKQGEVFGTVESVKAANDLYMPLSGTVLQTNLKLAEHPELVNQDPHGEGWMIEIELADPSEVDSLFDAAAYEAQLEDA
jgi:glycine cleavage system H protein